MYNFILIIICIVAGMVFRATKSIHPDAHKGINTWIIYIALPALSFKYIPTIQWGREMLLPALAPVIVFTGAWMLSLMYTKKNKYSRRTRSSVVLAAGYSNTSFMGFPIISAFYGEQYLSIAIICDQVSFLVLSTIGIASVLRGSNDAESKGTAVSILKRLITFPPLIGCLAAIILSQVLNLEFAMPLFDKLSATVAPLALFSIGLQLRFKGWSTQVLQIGRIVTYKLLLAPALVLVAGLLLKVQGTVLSVSVMEMAMPTLVTGSIIAEQYHLNTRLINLAIGVSIILSFLTLAFWYFLLGLW